MIWAALLVGGAVLFIPLSRGTAAVEVALGIASAVYGGLIGAFALGIFSPRSDQRSVSLGIVAGIGVVMVIWLTMPERVAWPWFAVIGTAVTFLVGAALGRDSRRSLP